MQKRYQRTDRVSELVSREISLIIDRELRDTRIGMVTVTGVEISKDLRSARVFVSVLGGDDVTRLSLETLNNASSFIRARLGERITIRHLPQLTFYFDSSTVEGMKMDRILDNLNEGQ